jgi:hypothetical protein
MKHFAKLIVLTLGIGVVVVVVSLLPRPRVAAAGETPATPVTVTNTPNVHVTNTPLPTQTVTQATANYVTVSCPGPIYVIASCIYVAGTPPAHVSLGSTVFPLPSGENFVVTDISWTFGCGEQSGSPGNTVLVELTNSLGTLYAGVAVLDASGIVGGRADHFTSGLVLNATPNWESITYDLNSCNPATSAVMQGYMVH